jgi:hypothetical protein
VKQPPAEFQLMFILVGKFDGFPLICRVRRLLKFCGRVLNLRCVWIDWHAPTPYARRQPSFQGDHDRADPRQLE